MEAWGPPGPDPVFHPIVATSGPKGTINPLGTVWVPTGAGRTFTFVPAAGWEVDQFEVDGVGRVAAPSFTFTNVNAPHRIHVYFKQTPVKLSVASVTASSDDGNVAANAIDGSLATRWSAFGDGQTITFDLGSVKDVKRLLIAFYKGNERFSTFDLQVADNLADPFDTIMQGMQSGGTSLALEEFFFGSVNARYVRLVGHGNNLNLWNSYTEVELWGN